MWKLEEFSSSISTTIGEEISAKGEHPADLIGVLTVRFRLTLFTRVAPAHDDLRLHGPARPAASRFRRLRKKGYKVIKRW